MKKDVALTLPYVAILVIDFYLLPFLAKDTGTAILFMLCIMPLIAVVSSIAYGARNGFHIVLPVAAVLLFIPTIFIHYNISAWVYAIVYGVATLVGTGIGAIFYKKR